MYALRDLMGRRWKGHGIDVIDGLCADAYGCGETRKLLATELLIELH